MRKRGCLKVDLTVVIVSYNSRRFLRRCLDSLKISRDQNPYRVILVDNASSDGTVQMVKKAYEWVDVIVNRDNVGFSSGCNRAIEVSNSEYILFLNPDIEVEPDAITRMLKKMGSSESTGVLGGLVFDASGIPQHSASRQIPGLASAFFHLTGLSRLFPRSTRISQYSQTHTSPFQEREVGSVSGSFMMIRKAALDRVGGFDERFFLYGEDMDICLRVADNGFKVLYYPEARAIHHHRTSTSKRPIRSTYHFYHSMALFYRKHYAGSTGRLFSPLVTAACWFMIAVQVLLGERIRLSGGVVKVEKRWMKFLFILLDLVSVFVSWLLAVYLRFGELKSLPPFGDYRSYLLNFTIVLIVTYGSLAYQKAYRMQPRSASIAIKSSLLVFIFLNFIFFYNRPIAFSRLALVYFSVFLSISMSLWRFVFHYVAVSALGVGLFNKRVIFASLNERSLKLISNLKHGTGYQVVGVVGRSEAVDTWEYEKPFLGSIPALREIVENFAIDEVVVVGNDDLNNGWLLISSYLRGCRVRLRLLTEDLAARLSTGEDIRIEDLPPIP